MELLQKKDEREAFFSVVAVVHGRRGVVEMVRESGRGYGRERVTSSFFRFVQKRPSRACFSGASLTAMGWLCMETGGVYWRLDRPAEVVKKQTLKDRRAAAGFISIYLLEAVAMFANYGGRYVRHEREDTSY